MAYSPYEVDKAPEFFKGDERNFLEEWVYVYLRYPQVAMDMGIQGIVNVEFVVEADGTVTNVKVTRSVDEDLDREAVRVVSASPKWRPAIKNGEKVRVKYSLPIEFRLKKR
jgi:TonB family protein